MSIHRNYIKSSNFILISAGLGVINLSLIPGIFVNPPAITEGFFVLLLLVGLAFVIRKGISWIKYLLLAMILIGVIAIPAIIKNLSQNPAVGVINIIQTVFQVWALILLFKIPKEKA